MGSKYTVIQLVPDPVADERLNAGVIVFDDARILVKLTSNWQRLKQFSSLDLDFFKDFARDLLDRTSPNPSKQSLTLTELDYMIRKWQSVIQFTKPRGSLLGVEQLLTYTFQRFMTSETTSQKRVRSRQTLRRHAKTALNNAIHHLLGTQSHLKTPRLVTVEGELASYDFQVGIVNAKPRLVAEAFSFADGHPTSQAKEIQATAWAFNDILKKTGKASPRLSVIVDNRDESLLDYKQAKHFFESLNVEIVPDDQIDEWADETVKAIADETHE